MVILTTVDYRERGRFISAWGLSLCRYGDGWLVEIISNRHYSTVGFISTVGEVGVYVGEGVEIINGFRIPSQTNLKSILLHAICMLEPKTASKESSKEAVYIFGIIQRNNGGRYWD